MHAPSTPYPHISLSNSAMIHRNSVMHSFTTHLYSKYNFITELNTSKEHFPSFTSIQHPPFFTIQMQVSNRPLTIFVKTFYPLIDLQLENLVIFCENHLEIAHYITSLLIWTMSCMCPRICCLFRIFVLEVDDLKLILTLPFSTLLNLLKIHTDHRTLNEIELYISHEFKQAQ